MTDGTCMTREEYQAAYGEKTGGRIYYTSDAKRQAASVHLYTSREIGVAVMDYPKLDASFLNFLEYEGGEDAPHFVRVDADVSGLTQESEEGQELDAEALQSMFRKALDMEGLQVSLAPMADENLVAVATEDEQMRRFREVYSMSGMPQQYALVLNRRNAAVQALGGRDPEDETTRLLCMQIYDLARMAAKPLEGEEITAFLQRSQQLITLLARQ